MAPSPPRRIVSLVASNTEIVHALGLADRLVGVDDYSDWPPEVVSHLPRVGRDLDIDLEHVRRLEPDLVLASQTVPGMEHVVEGLARSGLRYEVIPAQGLNGSLTSIQRVADLLGEPECGLELTTQLRARIEAVTARTNAGTAPRPNVYWEWWPRPLITAGRGSWINDMLHLAGGVNAFADVEGESLTVTPTEVARRTPDVVVLCYCGARKLPRPKSVRDRPGWETIPAVHTGRLYAVLETLFGRPGPRLVDGLEQLASLLSA